MRLPFSHRRAGRDGADRVPRLYAIGDLHGRLDLFRRMIALIEQDVRGRELRSTRLIVLGDVVDRGPGSAQLIDTLMRLRQQHQQRLIVLKGNHELAMTDALDGDFGALDLWLEHGGLDTLASFGLDLAATDLADTPRLLRLARQLVPRQTRAWLRQLPTQVSFGGYHFVHAGIRPGLALDQQSDTDRLWGVDGFLDSPLDHGAIVVHGHTISPEVEIRPNRIGVDTGAYRTGLLSAIAIEDDERRVLTVQSGELQLTLDEIVGAN